MSTTDYRRRVDRIFADVHAAVLKPRGFTRKKFWSIRRGDVLSYVNIDLSPWADDEYYPVGVGYGVNVPAGTEPVDLMWGVSDTLLAPDGRPVYSLHWVLDDSTLVEEFSDRLVADVVPFLDRFTSPADLVDFLAQQTEISPHFQPVTPVMRAQFMAYFAGAAGNVEVAQRAREQLVTAAESEGMEQYVAAWLEEVDKKVEQYRGHHARESRRA